MKKPRIAVLLDENTSADASRYEAHKGYFGALLDRGALAFGVPFHVSMLIATPDEFDGLLVTGARFSYPDDWYVDGLVSAAPASERLVYELQLIETFLARDKPLLGICAGMQAMVGLAGGKLHPDVGARGGGVEHDAPGASHAVSLSGELAEWTGRATMSVNSFHREGVVEAPPRVCVTARSSDGLIEAIAFPGLRFAHGVQWHPERTCRTDHRDAAIFDHFVDACR